MDLLIYLMICVSGFGSPADDALCVTYQLHPQYEMTQETIDRKIELICKMSRESAIREGGVITKCEVVPELVPDTLPKVDRNV